MQATRIEPTSGAVGANRYLLFQLGAETYGVPLLQVQEIRPFTPVTRIPGAPAAVLGVTNLRGAIIAVVDLRARFSQTSAEAAEQALIVVVNIGGKTYGMCVDSVSDVVMLDQEAIQPPPQVGDANSRRMVSGIAQQEDTVVILVNLEEALSVDDFDQFAA